MPDATVLAPRQNRSNNCRYYNLNANGIDSSRFSLARSILLVPWQVVPYLENDAFDFRMLDF